MKKKLILFLTTLLALNCYSQISFEKGYYIDNSDQKVDCQIKNMDWKNNPTEFKYKLSESEEQKTLTIKTVKEFGIYNVSKYIRYDIDIDRSSEDLNDMSTVKDPIFKKEQLFLKVLIEGKASLYLFEDGSSLKYFFNKDNSAVEQLIFKSYLTSENIIEKNQSFKQQLWENLKCQNFTIQKIRSLNYRQNDLMNFFVKYNECNNSPSFNFENKPKKDLLNLTLKVGLNSSSLKTYSNPQNWRDTDFGNKLGFRLGAEAEYIFPFNKNKWSIFIEPTYQYFKSEKRTPEDRLFGGILISNADYKSIEIPIGIRHYIFLNEESKIFLNAAYVLDFSLNSSIQFSTSDGRKLFENSFEISSADNLALGIGYKKHDKYSLELRYNTIRDILSHYATHSDYNTLSLIFGYSFF